VHTMASRPLLNLTARAEERQFHRGSLVSFTECGVTRSSLTKSESVCGSGDALTFAVLLA
jgi:hypothetical protein